MSSPEFDAALVSKSNELAQRMLDDPLIPEELKVRLRRVLELGDERHTPTP